MFRFPRFAAVCLALACVALSASPALAVNRSRPPAISDESRMTFCSCRAAWGDESVPYLVPFRDHPDPTMPEPPLTDEAAMRRFIEEPPPAWCKPAG